MSRIALLTGVLLLSALPASAALPPYYQRVEEMERILMTDGRAGAAIRADRAP